MAKISLTALCAACLSSCVTSKEPQVVTVTKLYVPPLEFPVFPSLGATYDEAANTVTMSLDDFEAIYKYKVAVDACRATWQAMQGDE